MDEKTVDSKYIQQHLANERTFLAWIRTSVAVVGLGFLAAGVVLQATEYERMAHAVAEVVGVGSVVLGAFLAGYATREYYAKRKGINTETFRAAKWTVVCLSVTMLLLDVFLLMLVFLLVFE